MASGGVAMDIHLPEGMVDHMQSRRKRKPKAALFVVSDGTRFAVLERWRGGFSTSGDIPQLARGVVDLFEGRKHLSHGLAYLESVKGDTRIYAFKTMQDPTLMPPVDHVRQVPVPAGLLAR